MSLTFSENGPFAPDELRRCSRSNMFVLGALYWDDLTTPVRLRNMSANGALVEGAVLPPRGTEVRLCRGRMAARGRVMWRSESQAGLSLTESINASEWLQNRLHHDQQQVDHILAEIRNGVGERTQPVGKRYATVEDGCVISDAASIGDRIGQIAAELADDPHIVEHHPDLLQRLDSIVGELRGSVGPSWV